MAENNIIYVDSTEELIIKKRLYSHLGHFVPGFTRFLKSFFGYGSKIEYMSFCTGLHMIPTVKMIRMSD